jgi:hypothetical protein
MQVAVGIRGTVIVDNDVNTFNVDTTAEDICRNQYPLLESLERSVAIDTGYRVSRGT